MSIFHGPLQDAINEINGSETIAQINSNALRNDFKEEKIMLISQNEQQAKIIQEIS